MTAFIFLSTFLLFLKFREAKGVAIEAQIGDTAEQKGKKAKVQ
jgi:hypothetical protein